MFSVELYPQHHANQFHHFGDDGLPSFIHPDSIVEITAILETMAGIRLQWLSLRVPWLANAEPNDDNLVRFPLPWRHNERDGVLNKSPASSIVYSTVYSGADQRNHQSSASLAFVWGIHRWPVYSLHKGPATRKMFPFDGVIIKWVWNYYHISHTAKSMSTKYVNVFVHIPSMIINK